MSIVIKGKNLGEVTGELKPLTKHGYFDSSEKEYEILQQLEMLCQNIYATSEMYPVSKLEVTNGEVEIKPHMLLHNCSTDLDTLENISKFGILPSEWFGFPESEREGVFCTFLNQIHDETDYDTSFTRSILVKDNKKSLNGKGVALFIDAENPITQQLLHLDYFEYAKIKQNNPEILTTKYQPQEIKLLDFIYDISPAGREMHNSRAHFRDWLAIPSGIPPVLINGINIKKNEYSEENLNRLNEIFPNATIFNGKREVLRNPKTSEIKENYTK